MRQKKEPREEQGKQLLAEPQTADQAGAVARAGAPRSAQDKAQDQRERVEPQAARMAACLDKHVPQRGKRGKALQRQGTDNDAAKMQPAHGVLQGYHGPAWVDSQYHLMVHAEASGNGQDDGQVAPLRAGATAHGKAIGFAGNYFEGTMLSADRHSQREAHLKTGAPAKLDAYIPDTHFRQRAPRFATPERPQPSTNETCTVHDFTYDNAHECSVGPNGNGLKLAARRHTIGNNLYRRAEAEAAVCGACLLREQGWQNAKTRQTHLAVCVEPAHEPLSHQRMAQIDPPAARAISGQRRAIVEPVVGNIRSQKR